MKKGEKMSDEQRLKIALSKRGKGNGRLGYRHSEETKAKMRKAAEGRDVSNLDWTGRTHTEESRKKIGEANKVRFARDGHPRWIKDRTQVKTYHNKKADSLYKQWMLMVKRRDLWKCQTPDNSCSGKMEAHHILNWTEYPDLRYHPNNGITLCHFHHPRGRKEEKRLEKFFQEIVKNKECQYQGN